MSTSYHYKTNSPVVLDAIRDWDDKLKAFHAQYIKLAEMFSGECSPMYSANPIQSSQGLR